MLALLITGAVVSEGATGPPPPPPPPPHPAIKAVAINARQAAVNLKFICILQFLSEDLFGNSRRNITGGISCYCINYYGRVWMVFVPILR